MRKSIIIKQLQCSPNTQQLLEILLKSYKKLKIFENIEIHVPKSLRSFFDRKLQEAFDPALERALRAAFKNTTFGPPKTLAAPAAS